MNTRIEPPVEGESLLPSHTLCLACGSLFKFRKSKKHCSARCRKAESKRRERQQTPSNAKSSYDKARHQEEKFELALRMSERLYTLPPEERLGYIERIIQLARNGASPIIRDILTTPKLLKPNPEERWLFYRKRPRAYCTIAQAANRYTLNSPWRSSVDRVVKGLVPDPATGEVFEDGSSDDQGQGFQSSKQKASTPLIEEENLGRPPCHPWYGPYHPWYGLGDRYPKEPQPRTNVEELEENSKPRETVNWDELIASVENAITAAVEASKHSKLPHRPQPDWGY